MHRCSHCSTKTVSTKAKLKAGFSMRVTCPACARTSRPSWVGSIAAVGAGELGFVAPYSWLSPVGPDMAWVALAAAIVLDVLLTTAIYLWAVPLVPAVAASRRVKGAGYAVLAALLGLLALAFELYE